MNDPLNPNDPDGPLDAELEDRLRAHFADRAATEPLPGDGAPPLAPRTAQVWWHRPQVLAVAAAVLVVALLGAVALRDDDPEDLETTNPSTTTTEATVPETTTTAILDTTTTSPPSTTTTVPPASTVRSVIVGAEGVLGWWDGSRFVRWDRGEVPLRGGEEYVVVGLDGTSTAAGDAPRSGCAIAEPYGWQVDVDGLEYLPGIQPTRLAVTGVSDPTPRPVESIGAGPYVGIAAAALAELGIDDPSPDLVQVLRTDFEGDGVDEVLLVAERLADPVNLFAETGDYSALLLRQVVDGEPVTTVVDVSHAQPQEIPFVYVSRASAVLDVNGDGVMELGVWNRYYEGGATALYVVDPVGGAERVIDMSCGV